MCSVRFYYFVGNLGVIFVCWENIKGMFFFYFGLGVLGFLFKMVYLGFFFLFNIIVLKCVDDIICKWNVLMGLKY